MSPEPNWKTVVPLFTIIADKIRSVSLDHDTVKYRVTYSGQYYETLTQSDMIQLSFTDVQTPWLWIGEGDQDMTEFVKPYILSGNTIRLELLEYINPSIKKWKYLDPLTLNEVDFPAAGITIKDDPRV